MTTEIKDNGLITNNFMEDKAPDISKEEKVATDGQGHLAKIKVGDKEYKVVNTVHVIDIVVHKLENGKEISQVIAHEFMMVEHKEYMVKLLTDAIHTVVRAKKRQSMVKLIGQGAMHHLKRKMGLIR